jgi:hypothetical protein
MERKAMKVKELKDKIVTHVQDHKELYIGMTAAAVAGGAFGYLVRGQTAGLTLPEVVTNNKIVNAVCWKPTSVIIQFVEKSTPSKPLHLVGTHQYFDSVSDAARKTGEWASMISRQINGHIPDVHGKVFEVVDVAPSQE